MTDIKDVIHFYLGGSVEFQQTWEIKVPYMENPAVSFQAGKETKITPTFLLFLFDESLPEMKFKLLLRPLDSMTEEESKDGYFTQSELIDLVEGDWVHLGLNPDQFLYLLKNSFDIFSLIESNQAIDKTKMK